MMALKILCFLVGWYVVYAVGNWLIERLISKKPTAAVFKVRLMDADRKETLRRWYVFKRYVKSNFAGELLESDNPHGPYIRCEEVED